MAYEKSKSAQDNFGKFIYQFQPKIKTVIRKIKLNKTCTQNVSLLFNQICLYIYIYTYIYECVYVCMYVYVCVCVCVSRIWH